MTRPPEASPGSRRLRLSLLSGLVFLHAWLAIGHAQLTLDGSLGPRGPLAGPDYRIGAELGQIRGGNLFHSFGEFNVPTGGSATFTGPNTIANILSRVTGGQPSSIDGTLRSEITGANLYLLNPSGVLFGPNASLAVSGSFHVSTADYLGFTDGAKFSSNLGQASVLTVAEPAAFGFLGNNPAAITISGSSLQVFEGKALSVVGGDLTIRENSTLMVNGAPAVGAPKGRIQLVSVASPGEVVFSRLELAPELQVHGFARLGRLELLEGTFISSHGSDIVMHAGSVRLIGGVLIDSSGSGPQPGGDVTIAATDSISTTLSPTGFSPFILAGDFSSPEPGGGDAGRIVISAPTIELNGGVISTLTSAEEGRGGDIDLRGGTLTLADSWISAPWTSDTKVTATATGSITFLDASIDGFSVAISAPILSLEGVFAGISGKNIEVNVSRLSLLNGSGLLASAFLEGPAGGVTVTATDSVVMSGHYIVSFPGAPIPSQKLVSYISAEGSGGRVVISTPSLHMDEGVISTDITPISAISGGGRGGDIVVRVGRLTFTGGPRSVVVTSARARGRNPDQRDGICNDRRELAHPDGQIIPSGLFSQTTVDPFLPPVGEGGNAGRVSLIAPRLNMTDGSRIAADTGVSRPRGDIQLQVRTLSLTNGAQITSSSGITQGNTLNVGAGQGGRIAIAAEDAVSISGRNSGIFSETKGPGRGGEIALQAGQLRLTDGAMISATSFGLGHAGNLDLAATEMSLRGHSAITTAATQASGGNIMLRAGSRLLLEDSTLSGQRRRRARDGRGHAHPRRPIDH